MDPTILLRRDEIEIDRAVRLLGQDGRAFILIVAHRRLWEAAAARFSSAGLPVPPEPLPVHDPDDIPGILGGAASKPLSLTLEGKEASIQAFNWHREKLRGQTTILLWLDGADALRRFRGLAPDAYAFRDQLLLLRGDVGLPRLADQEPPQIEWARNAVARATSPIEAAEASAELIARLDRAGRAVEAECQVVDALGASEQAEGGPLRRARARAALFYLAAQLAGRRGEYAQGGRCLTDALRELSPFDDPETRRLRLWYQLDPLGLLGHHDPMMAQRAIAEARSMPLDPGLSEVTLVAEAELERELGHFRKSLELSKQASDLPGRVDQAQSLLNLAVGRYDVGDLDAAEQSARRALDEWVRGGKLSTHAITVLVYVLCARGELGAAERLLDDADEQQGPAGLMSALRAVVTFHRGLLKTALSLTRHALAAAESAAADRWLLACVRDLNEIIRLAHDAGRVETDELERAELDVATALDVGRALGADTGTVLQLRAAQAEAQSLIPARLSVALDAISEVATAARQDWPFIAPEIGRLRSQMALRAHEFAATREALDTGLDDALSIGHQLELGRLLRVKVEYLVAIGEPASQIDTTLAQFHPAMQGTGSPKHYAEELVTLARALAGAPALDALALADQAHRLYLDLGIPAGEALALEAAGDALTARSDAQAAARRYQAAQAILGRFGLALRVPLLERKLALAPVRASG
jgi:tetratricopeptide (TPR) repeat protein